MTGPTRWIRHKLSGDTVWSPISDDSNVTKISAAGEVPKEEAMTSIEPLEEESLHVLPPTDPVRVAALAHNYQDLVNEVDTRNNAPDPLLFLKTPSCIISAGESILIPNDKKTWGEVELAYVIDKKAKNVSKDEADSFIRGYTIANDVTTIGIHNRDWHLPRSKARDTYCPIGPYLVTNLDTANLEMSTYINGEQTQCSTTQNMICGVYESLELISSLMTLDPGDVVLTGTPAGATESVITDGDMISVQIEDMGTLSNSVGLSN